MGIFGPRFKKYFLEKDLLPKYSQTCPFSPIFNTETTITSKTTATTTTISITNTSLTVLPLQQLRHPKLPLSYV